MKINYFKIYKNLIRDIELEIARLYLTCLDLEKNKSEITLLSKIKKLKYLLKLLDKYRKLKNIKIMNYKIKINEIIELINKYN